MSMMLTGHCMGHGSRPLSGPLDGPTRAQVQYHKGRTQDPEKGVALGSHHHQGQSWNLNPGPTAPSPRCFPKSARQVKVASSCLFFSPVLCQHLNLLLENGCLSFPFIPGSAAEPFLHSRRPALSSFSRLVFHDVIHSPMVVPEESSITGEPRYSTKVQ